MDWWTFEIPAPVALALMALIGYAVSRWRPAATNDMMMRSRRELRRAHAVALELDRIARTLRQGLARHHASVLTFKDRVGRLGDEKQNAAWKDLCREAEDILKPTLQLATQLAGAYDEIRQQSANLMTFTEIRTDSLTGVSNRRGLDDALGAQIALMARYHSMFSIVMFDIDHFKQVNDQEGHLHGDRVLQELSRLLDECARETDIVARYGGEEFVIVMPHTDLAGACAFSERMRQVADRLAVTVSGGVTAATDDDTPESLLARADTALYGAKAAGRNRVFYHTGDVVVPVALDEALSLEQVP